MIDLSLIPMEDLMIELSNRFDHIVIVGMKQIDQSQGDYTRRFKGNNHMCLGLLSDISNDIIKDQIDKEMPIEPEDK